MVCRRLYPRHRRRLADGALACDAPRSLARRQIADDAVAGRRRDDLGYAGYRSGRAPRIRDLLSTRLLPGEPGGNSGRLGGRHVIPRWPDRDRTGDNILRKTPRNSNPVDPGYRGARHAAWTWTGPAGQLRQRRTLGPSQRPALGRGLSGQRRAGLLQRRRALRPAPQPDL